MRKFNPHKKSLFASIFSLFTFFSSDSSGNGDVYISGRIVYSPCAIAVGSHDQTIDMGATPLSVIAKQGYGPQRELRIHLINCLLTSNQEKNISPSEYYKITFDAMYGEDSFGVHGNARGVELKIRDDRGEFAYPGVALPARDITTGDSVLNFSLQLMTNGKKLQPGTWNSLVRFRMDYN